MSDSVFSSATEQWLLNSSVLPNTVGGELEQLTQPSVTALNEIGLDDALVTAWTQVDNTANTFGFIDGLPEDVSAIDTSALATADPLTGDTAGTFANSWDPFTGVSNYHYGTLSADRFTVDFDASLSVISGNGNVSYGNGYWDYLDLSTISVQSVANISWAETGGVLFDTGNGARAFDFIQLSNGSQILFEGLDAVQFADMTFDLSVDTNDPLFSEQWNLHMMGVHNAWRFTRGSSNVLVGVQDTGLGNNPYAGGFHPDLNAANTVYVADNVVDDFFRNISDAQYGPRSDSHGTSVHSIISAATNNGYGMSGINWNSTVFNIDVLGGNTADMNSVTATQAMIDYANAQGQRLVINMSFGSNGSVNPALEQLVADNQDGALFVVASGNDDRSQISQPAILGQKYANVIAVGASWGNQDRFGNLKNPGDRISYPNSWGSNYGDGLSLMGPSEVIAANANSPSLGGSFDFDIDFNGTSAAAPNIAGVASLVWSVNPYLSATQVHQIMKETAFDLGTFGYDDETGYGFVNADAAVRRAMALAQNPWSNTTSLSFSNDTGFSQRAENTVTPNLGAFNAPLSASVLDTANEEALEDNQLFEVPSLNSPASVATLSIPVFDKSELSINSDTAVSTQGDTSTDGETLTTRSTEEVTRAYAQALEEFVAKLPLADVVTPEVEFVV